MTLEVRAVTTGEAPVVTALWHEVGLTRPWNDPLDDLTRALDGPSSTVLGGYVDGGLVATAMVGHDGHRGWLYYVAVSPPLQGSGLGREVVRAAEEWLTERGVPKVQLMVRSANTGVVGFYEGLGYTDAEVVVLSRWLGTTDPDPA